jgi:hypothetical protein
MQKKKLESARKIQERIKLFEKDQQTRKREKVNIRGIKITGNTTHISILRLNVNGHDSPNKRHRIVNSIKK